MIDLLDADPRDHRRNIAFDLPGCGDDGAPKDQVDLQAQIDRVLEVIDANPDGDVELVGHSIAGWLLPEAAVRRRDRVTKVSYIAAVAPEPGERGIELIPESRRGSYFDIAEDSGDYSIFVSFEDAWHRFFNHQDAAQARRAYDRLTRQPFQPYLDPATYGPRDLDCDKAYLILDEDRTFTVDQAQEFARRVGVEPMVASGDHCVMLSDPQVVVGFLTS